jgi:hypothetical protein
VPCELDDLALLLEGKGFELSEQLVVDARIQHRAPPS